MPKLKDNQVPPYRLHKQSGQAVVTLNGRDVLLGKHGTKADVAELYGLRWGVETRFSELKTTPPCRN